MQPETDPVENGQHCCHESNSTPYFLHPASTKKVELTTISRVRHLAHQREPIRTITQAAGRILMIIPGRCRDHAAWCCSPKIRHQRCYAVLSRSPNSWRRPAWHVQRLPLQT